MRVSRLVLVMALAGSALEAGCVADERFNPSGCDVQVRGQWFVDGQNPNMTTCENIALVELAIINDPETEFWSAPEFTLKCDAATDSNATVIDGGAFLDTLSVTRGRCNRTGAILENRVGPYKYRWRATTSQNFVVDCTPILSRDITPIDGGTQLLLDLPPVDFETMDGGLECPLPAIP